MSGAVAATAWPAAIDRALAIAPAGSTNSIQDVQHIVILMMENRSFDHYFGTLRGVRGFKDRHPLPIAGNKSVWQQSDGYSEISPFHLDSEGTSALKVATTPHAFSNTQAAWGQGQLHQWPRFKTQISMGHYRRQDIPFQFALADAFTICDAHHCSVATGTDPNRITFWSGSVYNPEKRVKGENSTDADSEPDNLRCWIKGSLPEPGYTYQGSGLTWPTIPEVLEKASISWKIYQDPNDNWTGAMHGCLAFQTFRDALPGSALYEKGMRHWSIERLADDVRTNRLPKVTWILPSQASSEHPSGSSPIEGGAFVSRVLDGLTANPAVWSKTAFFLTFDENDGLFDHVPPPAPPSYRSDGSLAGGATLSLAGEYFSDPESKYVHPDDPYRANIRPWGLGTRVPMYVISPWSRGGWVNSQVFDHTSVGQFIEKRFGVNIPSISPWHRVVSGDLTSCFDFSTKSQTAFPRLPRIENPAKLVAEAEKKPTPKPPVVPEPVFQEAGIRVSRALPYQLEVERTQVDAEGVLALRFRNDGAVGVVFHAYDRLDLENIPRRYTVEAGKTLDATWNSNIDGKHDLWIYGPNGFVREFVGPSAETAHAQLHVESARRTLVLVLANRANKSAHWFVRDNAYGFFEDKAGVLAPESSAQLPIRLAKNHNWYDFTVTTGSFERRFAGRVETRRHDVSDPA